MSRLHRKASRHQPLARGWPLCKARRNESRTGNKRVGEIGWAALVKYAEAEHKEAFLRALTPASGDLCCAGSMEETPCPKAVCIDLNSLSVVE